MVWKEILFFHNTKWRTLTKNPSSAIWIHSSLPLVDVAVRVFRRIAVETHTTALQLVWQFTLGARRLFIYNFVWNACMEMQRPDEDRSRELTRIFETIYNATSTTRNSQQDTEVIQLIKPFVDVLYDDQDKRPEVLNAACERFSQERVIKRRDEAVATEELKQIGRRWHIRTILQQHYRSTRADITLRQLHQNLRQSSGPDVTLEKMKEALPGIGFNIITTRNGNTIVLEDNQLRLERIRYIRAMQTARRQQKPIVYFSEANVDMVSGEPESLTVTNRLVLLFAAGQTGLVNFTFAHKQSSEITAENFVEWLQAVSSNLEQGTVLVVEDTAYTTPNRQGDMPSRRSMIRWLKVHDVPFEDDYTTIELRDLIRQTPIVALNRRMDFLRGQKENRIDTVVKDMGLVLMRIPRHHPELRPFGNAEFFAPIVVEPNVDGSTWMAMAELARNRVRSRLDESTSEHWRYYCKKIEELEKGFLQYEQFVNMAEGGGGGQDDTTIVIGSSDEDSSSWHQIGLSVSLHRYPWMLFHLSILCFQFCY